MAERSSAGERNKTAADLMSELAALLENDEKKKKDKKRSNKSVFFQRCPTTGQRVYFSKRQQQNKTRRTAVAAVPSQLSCPGTHEATTSAGNADNDIDIGL